MSDSSQLAPRWRRMIAAGFDLLLTGALAMFLALLTGAYEHDEDWVGIRPQLSALTLAFVSYLLINGYWLRTCGQTLGKRLLSIRAVSIRDGGIVNTWWYVLRLVPLLPAAAVFFHLAFSLAFVINLLPILLPARRCLHDYIAGTCVVRCA